MEEETRLREEISVVMDQVMENLGSGTMMIPEPVQRGLEESTNPKLGLEELEALRDDLRRLLA
jgi:hypothetical protein